MDDILNADIYKLKNPFDYNFEFMWDSKSFVIPANGSKLLTKPLAEHGARLMAEKLIQRNEGEGAVLQKPLWDKYIATVLQFVEANEVITQTIHDKVEELNMDEEPLSEVEKRQAAQEEAEARRVAQEEAEAFKGLTPETERKEALRENNPAALRTEELNELTKEEVLTLAKAKGLNLPAKSTKLAGIEAIVESEF